MKKRNVFILSAILLAAAAILANPAIAQETTGWYYCSINEIQTTTDDSGTPAVHVNLTETDSGAFTDKWVPLDSDYVKTGLATALTAVSANKTVRVRLELEDGAVRIYRMRLIND